ncbi:cation:proton antiporter [Niameybacter massiliensis]|uniref:cation:proton antiporter n=1 Tax=Niameybacter massiliensis TaxID=1658108 RepID=UPI0006B4D499|nr:cation:proton antiporter [Niameybacter massiliensis]
MDLVRFLLLVVIGFGTGKLMTKMKMPAILGWLIAGMVFGPHAIGLLSQEVMEAGWYEILMHIFECAVGVLIGSELIWKRIKKSGKQIIMITLMQSLGTFFIVSLVFGIVFYFMNIPIYLAVIFGGIALATAPAPALSIVNEYKTDGPVTKTLIPMAALDDLVGVTVFFTVMGIVSANISTQKLPAYMIFLVVLLPLVVGCLVGLLGGVVLKKDRPKGFTLALTILFILLATAIGFGINKFIFERSVLNFMLIGMAFTATFANMVPEERLEAILEAFQPVLGISLICAILNLGAPLNYHLIFGAGLFTIIYIGARAVGKIGGATLGGKVMKAPEPVRKYLGFTLLPHSGVSLVFTGIAVGILSGPAPECAQIIQGTIAAAAVINEVIAVFVAKQAFKWSGEMQERNGVAM